MAKRKSKSDTNSVKKAKLLEPERLPMPAIAPRRTHSVKSFVSDENEDWAQFLNLVRAGSSPSAAAACVYLPDATWREWLAKYKAGDRAPAIRKFGQELLAAIGASSAVAEATVAKENPGGWLKGPSRRLLSDDYSDNKSEANAVLAPTSSTVTNNVLVLSNEVQQDALKALERAGIINVVRRTVDVLSSDSDPTP